MKKANLSVRTIVSVTDTVHLLYSWKKNRGMLENGFDWNLSTHDSHGSWSTCQWNLRLSPGRSKIPYIQSNIGVSNSSCRKRKLKRTSRSLTMRTTDKQKVLYLFQVFNYLNFRRFFIARGQVSLRSMRTILTLG